MPGTVNTIIYLVIRKILHSRYYFIGKTRQSSLAVFLRSQLKSGRIRIQVQVCLVIKLYHHNYFPNKVHWLIQSWVRNDLSHSLGKLCLEFMLESHWKIFSIFWRMGDHYLKSSRLKNWESRIPITTDSTTYQSRIFKYVTQTIWFLVSLLIKWEHTLGPKERIYFVNCSNVSCSWVSIFDMLS